MSFQIKKFDSIVASMINWVSGATDKVTDFNVGSVIRTILEAVASELEELYFQLLKAVEEAIEEAIYRAFNFPRNPSERSTGLVRFYRVSGSEVTITIPRGTLVSTQEPPVYFETQADESMIVLDGEAIDGSSTTLIGDIDFVLGGLNVGSKVKNLNDVGESYISAFSTTTIENDTITFSPLTNDASFVRDIAKVFYDEFGVIAEYTTEARLVDGTYFPVGLVLAEDYIYLGSDKKFTNFNFYKGPAPILQDLVGYLIGEYWDGSDWSLLPYFFDGTSKGYIARNVVEVDGIYYKCILDHVSDASNRPKTGGSWTTYWEIVGLAGVPWVIDISYSTNKNKAFCEDGLISWEVPSNWIRSTYETYNLYWIRLKSDADLTSDAQGDALRLLGDNYKIIVLQKDIDVQALNPGISGNVVANSITVVRTGLSDIASISNIAAISDGEEEETNLERKERFALYIQSLARATKGALEYAAVTVEQIIAAKAIDDVRATVLREDYGEPSVFTDITSQMRNPGDAAVDLFEDAEGENDALYIGALELFDYLNMHLTQVGVIGTNNTVWEYFNGTDWSSLLVTDGTDAGTGPLTRSGTVSWEPPNDWVATIVPGFLKMRMWIRLRITTGGVFTTTPTGDYCSLPPGFGYVYLYCHDGSGGLNSSLQASVESAVELYRGCGIIVEVKEPTKIQPPITAALLVASNYDADDIAVKVKQALIDYLNTKVLGEDLFIAELYQFIMDKYDKAIVNTTLTLPTVDLIVPSSAVIRPDAATIIVTATTV